MSAPKRIRRRRVKGWRKPDGCIIVDRTSRWGNRWKVRELKGHHTSKWCVEAESLCCWWTTEAEAREHAVALFRWDVERGLVPDLDQLTGHDLACTCDPADGMACHADVLLELANPKAAGE